MKSIKSVTHLTLSIGEAHSASMKNHAIGPVVLAKGDEGTAIVIEATYRNRRERSFRAGYARFGQRAIWCFSQKMHVSPLSMIVGHGPFKGATLDEAICREVVNRVTDMANAAAAAAAPKPALTKEDLLAGRVSARIARVFDVYVRAHSPDEDSAAGARALREDLADTFASCVTWNAQNHGRSIEEAAVLFASR